MSLTKILIKSHIPKRKFFDGSKLNGVSLKTNSYDLFKASDDKFILRTSQGNPLISILEQNFKVEYVRHWWGHYSEYIITNK